MGKVGIEINPENIIISPLHEDFLTEKNIQLDILRLDLIHPMISGNKWFKLQYNIHEAIEQQARSLLSFGGAWSNHLHALAYAGKLFNLKTIGIIRGEEISNPTLDDCKAWGMKLHFISREEYRHKSEQHFLESIQQEFYNSFIIPEGGNNKEGRQGAAEILTHTDPEKYTHIVCPVGTGTTLSGLIESSLPSNRVIGISAIKKGQYLEDEIRSVTTKTNWSVEHDFHFGGFAKKTPELLLFMQEFKSRHDIELDFIYNAKMMFGVYDMTRHQRIGSGSRILVIHTGGLQGNRSLS